MKLGLRALVKSVIKKSLIRGLHVLHEKVEAPADKIQKKVPLKVVTPPEATLYVIRKDTFKKQVLLYKLDKKESVGWKAYASENEYNKFSGWVSAPDNAYSLANPRMQEAKDYGGLLDINPSTSYDETHKYSGKGYDANAPYGMWAHHALFGIQDKLNAFCYCNPPGLEGRDALYLRIKQFLDNIIRSQPSNLQLEGLPIGLVSNLLMHMSLYLGNQEHEDQQIRDKLKLDDIK